MCQKYINWDEYLDNKKSCKSLQTIVLNWKYTCSIKVDITHSFIKYIRYLKIGITFLQKRWLKSGQAHSSAAAA